MTTQTIFTYLLMSSLSMGLMYAYYLWVLKRESCFSFNRAFLLLGTLGALVLPLLRLEAPAAAGLPTLHSLAEVVITGEGVGANVFSWESALLYLYLVGVGGSLLLMGFRLWRVGQFVATAAGKQRHEGYTLVFTGGKLPTSSWFRYVFWDETLPLNATASRQMLAHELCHIRQAHSLDVLLMEVVQAFFWFNPFVYLIRRDLIQTHEYLADRAALKSGDVQAYKQLMLSRTFDTQLFMAHSFFRQPLKKRIYMLGRSISRRRLEVLAILTLPVLLSLFYFNAFDKTKKLKVPTAEELLARELPAAPVPPEAPVAPAPPAAPAPAPAPAASAAAEPDIKAVIAVDQEPKVLNMGAVQRLIGYPIEAREAGIEGTVVVRILVGEEGQYLKHKVINQAHELLLRSIEPHLPALRFEPALQGGKPVKFWVNIPFNFKLLN